MWWDFKNLRFLNTTCGTTWCVRILPGKEQYMAIAGKLAGNDVTCQLVYTGWYDLGTSLGAEKEINQSDLCIDGCDYCSKWIVSKVLAVLQLQCRFSCQMVKFLNNSVLRINNMGWELEFCWVFSYFATFNSQLVTLISFTCIEQKHCVSVNWMCSRSVDWILINRYIPLGTNVDQYTCAYYG